jgi:peptidoglycan/LPS O-acetylase OafA/YrhL
VNAIKNLDGVRGIAILLVVFFHLPTQPGWGGALPLTLPCGWMGVQLFFVLSGFLITRILIHSKDQAFGVYLRRFYVRRVLRIFPLYYGFLLALGAVYLATSLPEQLERYWPHLATFTWNWTRADAAWEESNRFVHLWSLSVEEQFYLVWPFLVFLLSRRGILIACVTAIVACPFVRQAFAAAYDADGLSPYAIYDATYWNTLCQLDAFAWGALLTLIPGEWMPRIPSRWTLAGGAALFVGCGAAWQLYAVGAPPALEAVHRDVTLASAGYWFPLGLPTALGSSSAQHVWGYTVINAFFATVVLYAVTRPSTWLLANRALVDIGKVSFGMYVLHLPVLAMASHFGGDALKITSWQGATLYLAVLYSASKLVYAFWERPFLLLKDRLAP